jgi:tRNA (guanine10-N2)-dimethyltransferase
LSRYSVLVSGENTELAKAEAESLIHAIQKSAIVSWNGRLGLFESETSPIQFLLERAALLRDVGSVIVESHNFDDMCVIIDEIPWKSFIGLSDSFCVRARSLTGERNTKIREKFILQIGAKIKRTTGARVSLEKPDVTFLLTLTHNSALISRSFDSKLGSILRNRSPGKRPFFHPSMMNPHLARAMCNLAGVKKGSIVFDPFCGGGGILCEAATLGARIVGSDLNWRLLRGAQTNLISTGSSDYCILQNDTQEIPIGTCDYIVTDPPYGRSSSTRGTHSIKLVKRLLSQAQGIVKTGGSMCLSASSEMNVADLVKDLSLVPNKHVRVRVHSGLTREIFVIDF